MSEKLTKLLGALLLVTILLPFNILAQDEEKTSSPGYLVITTLHWNMELEDYDKEEWLKVEKEYFDKVTNKNKYITGFAFMTHMVTADNTEALWIQAYNSWEDIEKAAEESNRLIEDGWADEASRDAFFDKQSSYYVMEHKDEIYRFEEGSKPMEGEEKEPMVYYMRVNEMKGGSGGTMEEAKQLHKDFRENVTYKNKHIQGYYVFRHGYGANSTDFVEVFVLNSLADMDALFDENMRLMKENWTEEEMDANRKNWNKYFTGKHGDYIYQSVPELNK